MAPADPDPAPEPAADLGPAPDRVVLDAATVAGLVAEQFPQWAHLPVSPVARGGWDNRTFRLGASMLVRLPSAAEYALAVDKEQRWLPVLAPRLPFPVPVPLGRGVPGDGFPLPWSVYGWLKGDRSTVDRIDGQERFARDLAAFVAALRAIDPTDGPRPGLHNWFRGGTLRTFDDLTRRCLATLADGTGGPVDLAAAAGIWAEALTTPWDGVEAWFHGDLAGGNLLLHGGRLAAVIDFGTCGVGDPACDLAIAWTMLDTDGRRVFRDHLDLGDDEWTRGRGWALWKSLSNLVDALADGAHDDAAGARRALAAITADRAAAR